MMEKGQIIKRIHELKLKQESLKKTWSKAGKRELLDFFIEILPRLLDADRCGVFILDPLKDSVWLESGTGIDEHEIDVPKKSSFAGKVISSGTSRMENDMENQVGAHDTVAIRTGYITYNIICAPVFGATRHKVIGAIQVLNKRKNADFTAQDLELLEKAAELLQIQVENIFARQEISKISDEMARQITALEKKLDETT